MELERQQVKTAEDALLAALRASEKQTAALEKAGQTMDFSTEMAEAGAEYSIKNTRKMTWEDQIKGWFAQDGTIKSSDSLYLGESEVWLDGVTSAPLYVPGSVMNKATRSPKGSKSGHSLTQAELTQIPARIKSAPAVIVNPSRNALIYVTDMMDSHGWPVVAAFNMNNDLYGETAHGATSIYGRESGLGGLLGNLGEDATIFVRNKNKFDALLSGTGKSYPQLLAKVKFADVNIAQPGGEVNGEFSLKDQSWVMKVERESAASQPIDPLIADIRAKGAGQTASQPIDPLIADIRSRAAGQTASQPVDPLIADIRSRGVTGKSGTETAVEGMKTAATEMAQAAQGQRDRVKVLHMDDNSFKNAANKIIKKSAEKYGTGLTMSANDGILNEKDVYAIDQYKKSGVAYPLNAALRSGTLLTDTQREIVHDIDQALLKLPTYQGTVYRSLTSIMMEDVQEFWDRYKPGEFVPELSYVSSSTEVYDETMDIQMVITSKRGCDMREYNALEQEILFRRGTLFFVEKREGNTIWLTEI